MYIYYSKYKIIWDKLNKFEYGRLAATYDLYYLTNDVTGLRIDRNASYGPYAHFGFRIPYYGQNVSLALSNWRGINASNGKTQVFSLKLIYEFND